MPTALLILAVLGLAVGPVVHGLGGAGRLWRVALDGLAVVLVAGLSLMHLAPHALEHGGFPALLAGVFGVLAPMALGRLGGMLAPLATFIGLLLLVLHAVLDGAALAVSQHGGSFALGFAVIAHRLPVGFAIVTGARRLDPARPLRGAWLVVGLLILATVGGFLLGGPAVAGAPGWVAGMLEAAVVGVLLHTVVEPGPSELDEHPAARPWSVIGALLGLVVLTAVTAVGGTPEGDGPAPLDHLHATVDAFASLTLASAPALLMGFATIGLLQLLPAAWQRWRGLPPILPLEAATLSVPLLGWPLALARVLLVGVFLAVYRFVLHAGLTVAPPPLTGAEIAPLGDQLRSAGRAGFIDAVDRAMPWMLVGLWVAALSEPLIGHGMLQFLPAPFHVPLMTLIGLSVPGAAAGATAVGAVALHQGMTTGSVLALVFVAPAARSSTLGLLDLGGDRATAIRVGLTLVLLALVGGWTVDLIGPLAPEVLHLPRHPVRDALRWLCVAVLAALTLASLVRLGPRGFLAWVVHPREACEAKLAREAQEALEAGEATTGLR